MAQIIDEWKYEAVVRRLITSISVYDFTRYDKLCFFRMDQTFNHVMSNIYMFNLTAHMELTMY